MRVLILSAISIMLVGCGVPMGYTDQNLGEGYTGFYRQCMKTKDKTHEQCEPYAAGKAELPSYGGGSQAVSNDTHLRDLRQQQYNDCVRLNGSQRYC